MHQSEEITERQYNTQTGLIYSTDDTIGYVGKNGHLEFYGRERSLMALNKTSLYVFSEDDFGVMAFDHIDALSRMNLHIKKIVPTEKQISDVISARRQKEESLDETDYSTER